MNVGLFINVVLAWLQLQLLPCLESTSLGTLAWRWNLGVKRDGYGYSLSVYHRVSGHYTLRLNRTQGDPVDLRQFDDLISAVRAGRLRLNDYRATAKIKAPPSGGDWSDLAA